MANERGKQARKRQTKAKGARKGVRARASRDEVARRNALPASVSEANPDRRRELTRAASSRRRFQSNLTEEQHQEAERTSSRVARQLSKGERAKSFDEVQRKPDQPALAGNVDHAILNHPRSEHEHRVGDAGAHIEGPAPRSLTEKVNGTQRSDESILEQLRIETKADNLYLLRRQERESENPRDYLIKAINERLREVQGDPILPE